MSRRLIFVWFVVTALYPLSPAYGQFTDPHNYDNGPVGVNQLEFAYGYAHSNASIDTSLTVIGAKFKLNEGSVTYTRYFGLVHRLFWVEASVPIAGLSGGISGTTIKGSTTGTGDSSYAVATLLKGGPAISISQFDDYHPTTTVGLSLTITAPTGQYNSNKILNLGSHRWTFKPEFAVSHPFGPAKKWQLDAYANAEFYTDNTAYRGVEILRQEPLPGVEAHLSYSFSEKVWASADTRYCFRGDTVLNGEDQDSSQQHFTIGTEVNVSLNDKNSLVLEFAKAIVHQNSPIYKGFAVKYSYSWGRGYK